MHVLAALRNAMVYLYARVKAASVPAAIEILQIHPDLAQQLLGISQHELRSSLGPTHTGVDRVFGCLLQSA